MSVGKNRFGEPDYLDEDPIISSQPFVLLSFATIPQNMKDKIIKDLADKHHMTVSKLNQVIADYEKEENPKRAIKVRGSGDADFIKRRYRELHELDEYFHILQGEVGKWMPFAQRIDSIENQQYSERQMNELIKGQKENIVQSRIHYQKRADELFEKAVREGTLEGQAELAKTEETIQSLDAKVQANKEHLTRLTEEMAKLQKEANELDGKYQAALAQNPDYKPLDPEANPIITKEYNLPAHTDITDVSDVVPDHLTLKRAVREDPALIAKIEQERNAKKGVLPDEFVNVPTASFRG